MTSIGQSEGAIEESTSGVMEMTMMEGEDYYNPQDTETWTPEISNQLCRICAKLNQYIIPIFEGEGIEHQLEPKIKQHLPIEVYETDRLPLQVCYQCASTLIAWSDLVDACIEADKKLHKMHEQEERGVKEEFPDNQIFECSEANASITSEIQSNKNPTTSRKTKVLNQKRAPVKSYSTRSKGKKSPQQQTPAESKDGLDQEMTERPAENIFSVEENGTIEQKKCNKDDASQDYTDKVDDTKALLCSNCGKGFATCAKLKLHENWMHSTKPKKYSCDLCERKFQHKAKYQLHLLKHSGTKNVVCEICGKAFYEKTELRQHMTSHSQERPFACKLCKGTFKRRTNLLTHEATMHGVVPDGHQSHQCTECGKTFLVAKLLVDHMGSHSREFRCSKCDQTFPNKRLYVHHAKSSECSSVEEPPEVSPCQCKVCGKVFKAKPNLRQHVRKVHEKGRNKLQCMKCGQECVGLRSYSYHVKHDCKPWPWKPRKKEITEKRTYQCKVCGKIFKANSNLSQHVRKVHEKDKYEKLCCTTCGKLFRWKICLDEHVRIHLNIKPCICKVCSKAFRTWSSLARHKKTHEDRRAYQCQVCGKRFKHSGALRAHLRIHSGIRPHSCGFCQRSFIYYNEKVRHHRKVHNIHIDIKLEVMQPISNVESAMLEGFS